MIILTIIANLFFTSPLVANEKVTINFFYYINMEAKKIDLRKEEALWNDFKKKNPDIDLKIKSVRLGHSQNALFGALQSGNVPDIIYLVPGSPSFNWLIEKKLLRNLYTIFDNDFLKKFARPALTSNNSSSNLQYYLPQNVNYNSVLYVNRRVLNKYGLTIPKTYEDLKKITFKLKKNGVQTILLPNADRWPARLCLFSLIVGRFMDKMTVEDIKYGKSKFSDTYFLKSLFFFKKIFDDDVINPEDLNLPYTIGPNLFKGDKSAFILDGDWRIPIYYNDKNKNEVKKINNANSSDFALINFPSIPEERFPGFTPAKSGEGLAVSNLVLPNTAKEKAIINIFKWYYGSDFQSMKFESNENYISSLKNALIKEGYDLLDYEMQRYINNSSGQNDILKTNFDEGFLTMLDWYLYILAKGEISPEGVATEIQYALSHWRYN